MPRKSRETSIAGDVPFWIGNLLLAALLVTSFIRPGAGSASDRSDPRALVELHEALGAYRFDHQRFPPEGSSLLELLAGDDYLPEAKARALEDAFAVTYLSPGRTGTQAIVHLEPRGHDGGTPLVIAHSNWVGDGARLDGRFRTNPRSPHDLERLP